MARRDLVLARITVAAILLILISVSAFLVSGSQTVSPEIVEIREEVAQTTRRTDKLESRIAELQDELARTTERADGFEVRIWELQEETLRLAYMDAEEAFTVFVLAVADLRQRITDKTNEMTRLQNNYNQGVISSAEYQWRYPLLSAEILDARMKTVTGTLDRMISSDDFSDLRSALILLREEAQPLLDEISSLASTISIGGIDYTDFNNRFPMLLAMFEQFDDKLTSAATQKLVQATDKVAREQGYDLVIRKKDVIMYRNNLTVDDITEMVKSEIHGYL